MDFDPVWVEVTFPMGMRPAQIFGDGQPFSTIDSDSEDGGAVDLVAGSVQPRGRGFGAQEDTEEDHVILDKADEDNEFSTLGTLSRNQIKIMASYIDNIVTGVVNDHMPLINYYYWEAYLDTKLVDKATLYPQGVPAKGQGEKGAAMRLEADLRGETQMVLRYEVTGQYSFVNITDTVLPSTMDVRTATAEALNANVLYRELRRSEHPMLSELELLTVDWADYGTNDASRTYKILGSVIFIMLLGLLGGIGYVYHKRSVGRKSRSGLIVDEVANDDASSWFSGDGSSIRRLSSWREGNDKNRGKAEVSPGKTANSEISRSFGSDGDLDASGMVSIPHGDAEESIISSRAPAGPMGVAKAKWTAFTARAFGRGEIISDSGSSVHEMDMSSRYYDDEPSMLPSESDESAIIEDASSVGDMTKFTKFTYQDIAKRKDVDLLDTCDPNAAVDESVLSQEESNMSLPHAYQIDQPTVPSDGEATNTVGEMGLASTVDPSLMQSEPEAASEVGERGADVSLLVSEAGAEMPTVEQAATENATDTPSGNELSAKNQIKATFASLWHKKKKDTPSKKFRYASSRQAKAAVVSASTQPQANTAGDAADHNQTSEVGSCREHPYINVSDDMSLISALSIGGVSTITAGTGVRSIPTASKDINLMPGMDADADAEDLHQSIALQEDAILEVDSEESSNEGSKKSDQAEEDAQLMESIQDQEAKPEKSEMETNQPEPMLATSAQPLSESEAEGPVEEERPAPDTFIADEADTDEVPVTMEVPRNPLYPQEPEEAESSDSEAENDGDESDAESDFPVEALDAKLTENGGDGSTVGYENIAPMEEENTVGSNDVDQNKKNTEEVGDILDNSDDHSVPTVYEEEDDTPNSSTEQPSSAEQAQSDPVQALASESAEQEATPPLSEAVDAIVTVADDKDAPEDQSVPTPQFEIDADIKDALESKPSGESSEDELDGEIRSAVEECSMVSESDEEEDAESTSSSSSSTSSLIQEIVPNASPKRSPKRVSSGADVASDANA